MTHPHRLANADRRRNTESAAPSENATAKRLRQGVRRTVPTSRGEIMTRSVPHLTLTATAVIAAALASGRAPAAETLQYNRDIRPILCENCFTCHGPDSAARKAGLRLENATRPSSTVPSSRASPMRAK